MTAFLNDSKAVAQIMIETENCKTNEDQLDKALMQNRVKELIKTVSNQIFEVPFELNGDRYFKELGPHWNKPVQVSREPYNSVKSMRLSRGISKCDARGGYRFRYDFFSIEHPQKMNKTIK